MSLVITIATQDYAIIAGDHRCTHIRDDNVYYDAALKVFNVNQNVIAGFTGDVDATMQLVNQLPTISSNATVEQVAQELRVLVPDDAYLTIMLSGVAKDGRVRLVEMSHRDNFTQHITDIPDGEVRWLSSYAYVNPNDMIAEEFSKIPEGSPQEVAEMIKGIIEAVSVEDIRVSKECTVIGIVNKTM